ncbi:AraC-like ligand-binding domain-containing protein [Kitasatospora purpeofusca]|uniref:AraC-like ligand-binding domain-containing protein n=1 Tax=Kitasatospora purpeofusca TaxID=67352 RepID=UPI00056CC588|nr:helix-turn-helix domain-containing protein [Kitasatospora purpeofusca]
MGYTVLSTTSVPAEQRFDLWCDLIGRSVAPVRVRSRHTSNFLADAGSLDLGAVRLTTMSFPPIHSLRTPALIRNSDPEGYELALILDSEMSISQSRQDSRLSTGDFALWSTSLPYEGQGLGGTAGPLLRGIVLHLPRSGFPLPSGRVDRVLARALPGRSGAGAVLAAFLRSVVDQAPSLKGPALDRMGTAAWELTAAFLAHHLDAHDRLPPEARTRMLLARINAFIEDNLAEPALSPASVAVHHGISVRTLHYLFRQQRETVSATIRSRRLARCHAALSDPALRALPVHAIGARWGFTDAATFSRSFRSAYGITPAEHRRSTLPAPRAARTGSGRLARGVKEGCADEQ